MKRCIDSYYQASYNFLDSDYIVSHLFRLFPIFYLMKRSQNLFLDSDSIK
jgi:hypothetical protein